MSNNLEATFKSQDTEEWLDIHFTRPLGLMWANLFNRFNVHPNVVTLLSIVLGAAAGVMSRPIKMSVTSSGSDSPNISDSDSSPSISEVVSRIC